MSCLGSMMAASAGSNLFIVLIGLFIRSIGSLPSYVMASYLADVLDDIEDKNKIRVDGFSASVSSMTQTIALGLCQTILLFGISYLGYIPPSSTTEIVSQPDSIVNFFSFCFAFMPIIGYGVSAVLISFYKLENRKT